MKADLHNDTFVQLIEVLERSFERSGVFYIGTLSEGHQHERVEQLLTQHLEHRHISTVSYHFDEPPTSSFQDFIYFFNQVRAKGRRQVLVTWCLEHLDEPILVEIVRSLNANRGRLCQTAQRGQASIPTLLLIDESYYREYLARQARDLLDCLSPPFDLSAVNIQEAFNGDVS